MVAQKKINRHRKTGEKAPSLEVVEVALVQCNLVDNQYRQSLKYYVLSLLINLMLIC